jgi:hypothetical protein
MKNLLNNHSNWKSNLTYPIFIAIFAILALAYVSPVLEGKRILQSDIVKFDGMAKEIKDFRNETGEEALWTNSMFGGMPAYQISVEYPNNISNLLHKIMTLGLPRPADMIFLYFICFFVFLLLLRVNPWVAFAGAVAFALSSYNYIIISAGHNSKAVAIAYMAPVLGSIIYTFRGKYLAGGILFSIFLALQIFANHFQITYYLLIVVVFYGIFELIDKIKKKQFDIFLKAFGVLILAAIVALGVNISRIWTTYEYTEATMRGGSELSMEDNTTQKGLDIEYITAWSYGKSETFSLLIPNIKGGATGSLGNNKSAMKNIDRRFEKEIANYNQYWGNQPFTSGPVYLGAIVIFFFIFSLFYIKGPIKYGLLAAIILSIVLAWGKNFMPLTQFFVDYVPGYDKFRAVSMTLTIAAFCVPALAALGIAKIIEKPEIFNFKNKYLYISFGLTGGLALLFYLIPGFFSFLSNEEIKYVNEIKEAAEPGMQQQLSIFIHNLESARISIFKADAIRSFGFILLAAILTLSFSMAKFSQKLFVIGLTALIIFDMWTINRRYLNDDNFVAKRRIETPFAKTSADDLILKDKDKGIRVLDMTESTFNSSRTSYYHMSLGGYHGAKLQRYQDIIDFYLTQYMQEIGNTLNKAQTIEEIYSTLVDMPVLHMLNTRYIIIHKDMMPIINTNATGNAWFIDEYVIANNANEELMLLKSIEPQYTAVIDKQFIDKIEGLELDYDSDARIILADYKPNRLIYKSSTNNKSIAVFSEIYYPKGWNVYINGEKAEHFRANYILRAMLVPEGENEIIFEFKPKAYYTGESIALVFSILMVLLVLGFLGFEGYKFYKANKNQSITQEN